ncbi:MAG: hypothetical protein WD830_04745 [Chloroflexota bacterium]
MGVPIVVVIATLTIAVYAVVERRANLRLGWFISPVLVLATLLVLNTGAPRHLRFHLAEPELTAFAEEVAAGHVFELPWYGDAGLPVAGMTIYQAYAEAGGLWFGTGNTGILDDVEGGLAYMPDGPPGNRRGLEHLRGPWYRWSVGGLD